MGLPNEIVMPGDGAANPFSIPVPQGAQSRTYRCAPGSAITVPGEDAQILRVQGWVGIKNALVIGEGPTSGRPVPQFQGQLYVDTTIGATVIWGGPKTGWLNSITGAPS